MVLIVFVEFMPYSFPRFIDASKPTTLRACWGWSIVWVFLLRILNFQIAWWLVVNRLTTYEVRRTGCSRCILAETIFKLNGRNTMRSIMNFASILNNDETHRRAPNLNTTIISVNLAGFDFVVPTIMEKADLFKFVELLFRRLFEPRHPSSDDFHSGCSYWLWVLARLCWLCQHDSTGVWNRFFLRSSYSPHRGAKVSDHRDHQ
mmetsp:Transcript_2929/g.4937  ORF Transcript_2929/g.4937 Transcript_2929/m.4937 type:complete len:204 (+) Transcript_2929:51-662(+)